MRLLDLTRHPTSVLRALLVGLALTLGANAIAHAEHDHTANTAAHAAACGYCTVFGGLAGTPTHAPFVAAPSVEPAVQAARSIPFVGHSTLTHTQPRAPPVRPSIRS